MILIDEYFRHYPARKKVAEFLLRHGIEIRNGSMLLDGVELPITEVARATGVTRKVVYLTVETIENTTALRLLFERLRPELRIEDLAPAMNWEVLELRLAESDGRAVPAVLDVLLRDGNRPISVRFRNLPGEAPYLSIVVERPISGEAISDIEGIGGIERMLIKTPEKVKTKLVCTFCEVKYCPRRLSGGVEIAD
ncbi:regulator of amino acid metabolism, contains ACT domain protein [Thermococcus aciditolerans]|uniref:Regulator of amino acid metabolism, contains ACT domain protein n=1 Tax=Thermococcus aciditolerans TaxID=2598455 RepID=A0A5C0SJI5_9EURY|nr:regulator of amino acid metabolism, contains ACT domain protein [Thermococcus aciditolerans]QEK13886.1 regulator of amino acid metabolism, contains ACT domain protein [Thermococcus aciditolerans]